MQEQGAGRPSGTVLIRARHSGTAVCAVLTIVWAAALAASVSAQSTASGKIGAGAVFEDYGDKIIRTARSAARDAYRCAARAQRAFTGYAPSPGAGAARLGQADRIDGKARG